MPTIEGKQAEIWITDYVNKAGELKGVLRAARALVKKTLKGAEEYVTMEDSVVRFERGPSAATWPIKST
ncbi:MAG TPA: hypothetical protein VMI10_25110 [Terriglobales bacterium]|nr:hypothetical protein [Terriglobales bacterium]